MFEGMLNGMFGKIGDGMCRLSMNGSIAVKTSNGYKTYNVKTGKLTNCSNFVFDIGQEFFFCIPTNKVEKGDIIPIGGKPKCVIGYDKNTITVINYEDSTIDTVIPERHMFMGNTYFYGKIVSMFGDMTGGINPTNNSNIMSFMMMNEMMKGKGTDKSNMLPFMMMSMMNGNNPFAALTNAMGFGNTATATTPGTTPATTVTATELANN